MNIIKIMFTITCNSTETRWCCHFRASDCLEIGAEMGSEGSEKSNILLVLPISLPLSSPPEAPKEAEDGAEAAAPILKVNDM